LVVFEPRPTRRSIPSRNPARTHTQHARPKKRPSRSCAGPFKMTKTKEVSVWCHCSLSSSSFRPHDSQFTSSRIHSVIRPQTSVPHDSRRIHEFTQLLPPISSRSFSLHLHQRSFTFPLEPPSARGKKKKATHRPLCQGALSRYEPVSRSRAFIAFTFFSQAQKNRAAEAEEAGFRAASCSRIVSGGKGGAAPGLQGRWTTRSNNNKNKNNVEGKR
jgi:hypothetical protein